MTIAKEIKWPSQIFVTGIDTDAGKSYATGKIAVMIKESGESVITQKFVQTGNRDFSEDIKVHRNIMGCGILKEDVLHLTAPVIFSYPASPDLAAKIDNTEVNFTLISEATEALGREYAHVLIEGAGGLMVPLKGDYLTIDYVCEHSLPVVLVTNGKLGSISHTLLAMYAIKHSGLELFAVVYNKYFDSDKLIAEDARNYIEKCTHTHFPTAHFIEID